MSAKLKIRVVAIGYIVISIAVISLMTLAIGFDKLPSTIGRFALTCLLSWLLIREKNYARIIAAILSCAVLILGALTLYGAGFASILSGGGALTLVIAIFNGWAAYVLLFDPKVKRQFMRHHAPQ